MKKVPINSSNQKEKKKRQFCWKNGIGAEKDKKKKKKKKKLGRIERERKEKGKKLKYWREED